MGFLDKLLPGHKPLPRPPGTLPNAFGTSTGRSSNKHHTKRSKSYFSSATKKGLSTRTIKVRKLLLPAVATLAFVLAATASLTGTAQGWAYLVITGGDSGGDESTLAEIGVAGYCMASSCHISPFYSLPNGVVGGGDDGSGARTASALLGLYGLVSTLGPLLWLSIWTRYIVLCRRHQSASDTYSTPNELAQSSLALHLQTRKWSRWLAWSCALASGAACAGTWIWALSSSSGNGSGGSSDGFSYRGGAYTAIAAVCLFFLWALLESAGNPATPAARQQRKKAWRSFLHRLRTAPRFDLLTSSRTWSILIGLYYVVVSLVTLVHDFRTPDVQAFIHAKYVTQPWQSLPKPASFQGDAECAYFRGASLVNQGTDIEPWFWFTGHHALIVVLSACLMLDEWTNRRMGCLGPQQNKGGPAWTGIYLFTSVFSRCLAHGSKAQVEFTYLLGWLCLGVSILNMIHGSICSFGWRSELRTREDRQEQIELVQDGLAEDGERPLVPFAGLACKVNAAITDVQEAAQVVRVSAAEDSGYSASETLEAKARWRRNILAYSLIRGLPSQVRRRRFRKREVMNNETGKADGEEGAWNAFDPWHDGRRAAAVLTGLVMAIIQMMLICANVSMNSSWSMSQQYVEAQQEWQGISMWGAGSLTDICAFYNSTAVPIHPSMGADPLLQANTSVTIYFFNRAFLLMMSLCVMTVALSNQRTWGQTLPGCFSLLGPRNSSFSIGYTLIHIALATLSSAIFPTNAIGYQFCRFSCYFSLVVGISFYLVAEDYSIQVDRPEPYEGLAADGDPYGPRMPFLRAVVRTEKRMTYGDEGGY